MVKLDALYIALKSAARFSGLGVFAVLEDISDLNAPNLKKIIEDYKKPYFFSKKWEESGYNTSDISFNYPGLFVIETGKRYYFSNDQPAKVRVSLEISVIDRYIEGRLIPEIERDTSYALLRVMHYIQNVQAYSDGTDILYLNSEHAKWLKGQGESLTTLIPETASFKDSINEMTRLDINGFTLGLGSDDLHGSFIRARFIEYGECDYEYDFYSYDGHLKDLSCGCC